MNKYTNRLIVSNGLENTAYVRSGKCRFSYTITLIKEKLLES